MGGHKPMSIMLHDTIAAGVTLRVEASFSEVL